MHFYKFQTFSTSYYFPTHISPYQLQLYGSRGGILAKLYWWLFRHFALVRNFKIVTEKELDFSYPQICAIEKHASMMAFNLGSPGKEQKVSMLGFDPLSKTPFFAKFAQKPAAMALSVNEIAVLTELADSELAPALMGHVIGSDYVWLKTAYVAGNRITSLQLSQTITEVIIRISRLRPLGLSHDGLYYTFAHGDFCPWNVLKQQGGKLQPVDWEMARCYPLGYDMFTWIFQPSFMRRNQCNKKWRQLLSRNQLWLKTYFDTFGIVDYAPYLTAFATIQMEAQKQRDNHILMENYRGLLALSTTAEAQ